MGNIADGSTTATLIVRGGLHDFTGDDLVRVVDIEDTMPVMTNNIFGNRTFITVVARFVKFNTQKFLSDLRALLQSTNL